MKKKVTNTQEMKALMKLEKKVQIISPGEFLKIILINKIRNFKILFNMFHRIK